MIDRNDLRRTKNQFQHALLFTKGSVAIVCSLALLYGWSAEAAGLKTLVGHVPEITRGLTPKGKLASNKQLNLAIGLPMGDPAGLEDFLRRVYDPKDSAHGKYLSPSEFADRFGPTKEQYEQVIAFAVKNHLTVTGRHMNRLVLDLVGSVADVQRAFKITMQSYQHPTEARDFYAPDVEPSVDAELPVADISGLNNFILPHPRSVQMAAATANPVPQTGSGPSGTYRGNDFRSAYLPGVTLTGAGQTLGLLQFDGFYSADIAAYEAATGLPQVPLQTVLLDGYSGVPTVGPNSGNGEVSLDVEMAVSMAPGLSKIVVFEAGPNGQPNDILSAMTSHPEIKQLSCSWGWGGGPRITTDNLFKQLAAQGQSFFSASGDSDAFPSGAVDDPNQANTPSDCPYITVVGGTTLTTAGPGGAWSSESVWNRGGGIGSSGGISSHYALPSWQSSLDLSAAGGSSSYRNTPDVALVAENIFVQYGNGTNGAFGGTSCAAPLWAGLAALMNQQALALGRPSIGFVNPAIYAVGKSGYYAELFNDITSGNNTWSGSSSAFYAVPGYDLCTGWGTPRGQGFVDAFAGPHDPLTLAPAGGVTIVGPQGGPFLPATAQFVLSNSSTAPLNWSLVSTSIWMTVNPQQGTLEPSSQASVTVGVSDSATGLSEANHTANVIFSNEVSHLAQTAPVSLQVGQSIVENGGFETGDFSDWTLTGHSVVNSSLSGPTVYNAVEANGGGYQVAHSGTYGAFLGDTQLASLSQNLETIPGQSYLVSLWLNNPTSGTGQQFAVSWNPAPGTTNTLLSQNAPGVLAWTNLQFVVTASQAKSTLKIEAENDSDGFGLDDVSVKPLPVLGFQSIQKAGGNCTLVWRAASGVKYQVQYTTDLVQGPWVNLGSAATGSGQSLTINGPNAGEGAAQRFYRLAVSP